MDSVDARPSLSPDEQIVVELALRRARVRLEDVPPAYESSWRRAGARESVGSEPAREGYARSPRSTRGATRA